MTFVKWLLSHKGDNSPLGDLARDVSSDANFPNTQALGEMLEYLEDNGACDGAIKALKTAWMTYTAEQKANP